MTDEEERPRRRIELNGLQVAAATAAAVTATVAASALGVAGTIIGAVLASVISTVGSALYLASMKHTKERLKPLGKRFSDVTRVDGETIVVASPPASAPTAVLDADATSLLDAPRPGAYVGRAKVTAPRRVRKRWKAVAATAAIVCVMTLGLVTITEAFLGHPLSGLFGDQGTGTSINHTPPAKEQPRHTEDPVQPTEDPTETPTPEPTTPSPTPSTSSATPTPSPSTPSPSSPSPAGPGADAPR